MLLAGFATVAQAADELVISSATPPRHIQTLTMTSLAKALMERSGGTLKAKAFDSSQLCNASDVGKAVALGDVGMATVPSPYLSRIEANINVLDLPFPKGMTAGQRSAMLDREVGEILNAKLGAKMGVLDRGGGAGHHLCAARHNVAASPRVPDTRLQSLRRPRTRLR